VATYLKDISRTFNEYLLLPNLTRKTDNPSGVDLGAPLSRFKKGSKPSIRLKLPMVSAIMQAVSGPDMAISLARMGGLSFIFQSQSIESQAQMIRKVKAYKAGYVTSDSNLRPESTLRDASELRRRTGHGTIAVTSDGTPSGKLLGLLTSRDYRLGHHMDDKVSSYMTKFKDLILSRYPISLSEANELIWESKLNCLPLVDKDQRLQYLVFRKDYDSHKAYPNELVDEEKRLMVGAGINTRDYTDRVPALVEAGADALCIDSSDGFSEWQGETLAWVKKKFGNKVPIGAGNVVDKEGFRYLVKCGADFIKVGIGGGSICITREQKGIGRGQASALADVVEERDQHFKRTGEYIPVCSDGGILYDYHMTLALAMGADFLMLGRYFARFDQSPSRKLKIGGNYVKEYWGEGSDRARNWQRYDQGGDGKLHFEEGVDGYVPYAGDVYDNLEATLVKIKTTMCNCGSTNLKEFHDTARLALVSQQSYLENTYQIQLREREDVKLT
jgi:IMP dehydrogenase